MDTAGSLPLNGSQKYYSGLGANAIIISPENGDIRWLVGGTPTSTIGTQISQGSTLPIAGIDLSQIKLIATGGSVTCNVQLYKSEPGEGLALGSGGGSALSYDAVTDSDKVLVVNPTPLYEGALIQEDFTNLAATFTRYATVNSTGTVVAQFDKTGGADTTTYKIYGSAENNGTADSSASYVDITQYGGKCLTGPEAASFTTDCAHRIDCKGWKFLKFEITISGGANDADGSLFVNYQY